MAKRWVIGEDRQLVEYGTQPFVWEPPAMKRRMLVVFSGQFYQFECESHSRGYPIYAGMMVCPYCGRTWATLSWQDQSSVFEPREVRGFPCELCSSLEPQTLHPDLRPVGGSLLDNHTVGGYNVALLEALPEPLLRREFELTLSSPFYSEKEI